MLGYPNFSFVWRLSDASMCYFGVIACKILQASLCNQTENTTFYFKAFLVNPML